jgi:hypothetical protein
VIGQPCTIDGDCGPPDFVCKSSTHTCAAGCTIDPSVCFNGWLCHVAAGRCCAPTDVDCYQPAAAPPPCLGDGDCAGQAGTVCARGACLPGCAQTGCAAPLGCAASGHCAPSGGCARDADCDAASYCAPNGTCVVLGDGGPSPCRGGAVVSESCNPRTTGPDLIACAGAAGPAACPFCFDGSCYHPGLCASASDCHAGDACTGGLCRAIAPACPTVIEPDLVLAGAFAAGREVCVHGAVSDAFDAGDGDAVFHVGTAALAATITPLYLSVGVAHPAVGAMVTVHGTVRWDNQRQRWELLPVDDWQ